MLGVWYDDRNAILLAAQTSLRLLKTGLSYIHDH